MAIRRQLESSKDAHLIELNKMASNEQLLKLREVFQQGAKDERQQIFNERIEADWGA